MNKTIKTVIIVAGIIIGIILILSIVPGLIWGRQGFGYGYGYGTMRPWMMGGFGGMSLMPILWIVFVGLIIWAVVAVVQGPGDSGTTHSSDSALEILKRRYARGEIGREEFEEKKKDLV